MATLSYRESGSGPSVILLHGFPLNQHLWDEFAEKLSEEFHVITPDLPGFGKSKGLPEGFTLEDVATTVLDFIAERKFVNAVVVGHSLGGYVTLAMAEQRPEQISGLCLFHSTAVADTEEKRQSRNKVIDFINKHGVHAYTSNYTAQLYADPLHSSITKVKSLAVAATAETVIGYTHAMRDRKDRTELVKSFPRPILFIAGERDQNIPAESILQQAALNENAEAVILPAVGHMGMFEAEAACLRKISGFIKKSSVTL